MSGVQAVLQILEMNPDFPFLITQTNNELYKDIIYCHWHHAIEFIYVTEGALELMIDLETIYVHKGEAAFINRGEVHYGNANDGKFCNAYAMVFEPEMLCFSKKDLCQEKYIAPILEGRWLFPRHIKRQDKWGEQVLTILEELLQSQETKEEGYEISVKIALYQVISILSTNKMFIKVHHNIESNDKIERLKKAILYIETNYEKRIYISELAQALNISEDYFFKLFKKLTGTTPIDYLNFYRIQMAGQLLRTTSLPISEVCFSVGFENISYFIKIFKRHRKCTPKEYRSTADFSRVVN